MRRISLENIKKQGYEDLIFFKELANIFEENIKKLYANDDNEEGKKEIYIFSLMMNTLRDFIEEPCGLDEATSLRHENIKFHLKNSIEKEKIH
jgi:hypothetical protein